ncbi:MAG TPA: hypothetical protein VH682_04210 [Gemmataceae bacterium]|jgi:hypothetical protein
MISKRSLSFCLSFCILHSAFCIGVAAAEPDLDAKAAPRGLLSGLFNEKPRSKAKADKLVPVEDKPAPTTVEMAVSEQQRQMNAYLRRVQVCLRLRQVAIETNNADLQRQADDLEARAWEIYGRKTARLPIPTQPLESSAKTADKKPAVRETSRAADKELDEAPPAPQRPPAALNRLGGNFEQRERSILDGTSMGRDKP